MRSSFFALAFASCICALAACGDDLDASRQPAQFTLSAIIAPNPVIAGTPLRPEGTGLESLSSDAFLRVEGDLGVAIAPRNKQTSRVEFMLTPEAVEQLGLGRRALEVYIEDQDRRSQPIIIELEIAQSIPVSLSSVPEGGIHRNDVIVIRGGGFLFPTEGTVALVAEGTFTAASGAATEALVRFAATPVEAGARDRASVTIGTEIGGLAPGEFTGEMFLEATTLDGTIARSTRLATSFQFQPAVFFSIEPNPISLEHIATIRGAGFVGGPDNPDEGMFVRLRGTFAPFEGTPVALNDREVVLTWVSGTEARFTVEAIQSGPALVSKIFGAARGQFDGTALAVTVKGATSVEGVEAPLSIVLGPIKQVVHLRFLPGFYDSLSRFGLTAASGVLEDLVVERVESIYEPWDVDLRLDEPTDVSVRGYASVEVGGPDPNDLGLFGYDNTPGKDIGNVRLFDAIGGENAETQADQQPGYGGVFVDSFFYFSSHPDDVLPNSLGPPPDPLFDEIFDPVRADAATLKEIQGEGSNARVARVRRALTALASMIGETVAHELGHSFGLADPYGPPNVYHNVGDGDGCLMDSGSLRQLGERTAQAGYPPTRLCYDAPNYLDEVFAKR